MKEAVIRHALKNDAAEIAHLLGELGYPAPAAEVESRLLEVETNPEDAVFVAENEGRVVGCLSLHIMPYFTLGSLVCRITALVVISSMRGRGIGKNLVRAAELYAQEKGCSAIEVTSADYRSRAHEFYTSLDYPRTSVKFFKSISPDDNRA